MIVMAFAAAAVLVAAVGSEFALRGTRLQTALLRALSVWLAVYATVVVALLAGGGTGVLALTIFWGGAFLSWFGVRSHIESSILFRMLVLLRRRPMTDAEVAAEYLKRGGESARIAELRRGGLIVADGEGMRVTPKGKMILSLASRLR